MKDVFFSLFYLSLHNLMHVQKKDPILCNKFLCTCAQHGRHHPLSSAQHSLTPRTVLCHITYIVSCVVTFLTYMSLLYAFFWVIPQDLNFICQRFGTLCFIVIGGDDDDDNDDDLHLGLPAPTHVGLN